MKKLFYALALVLLVTSCTTKTEEKASQAEAKIIYHYSAWAAFVNKIFDGRLTVSELKSKGDIGLGSFNGLDGELVMLDHIVYRADDDGVVTVAADSLKIPYATATFFKVDSNFEIEGANNYDSLRTALNNLMGSKNYFYAFKIHGTFSKLKLGGVPKQTKPYTKGLDELIPERPVFEKENLTGTMVGFYCPELIGQINVAGFHLHFVSDDKKSAGHVMEFEEASSLEVEISKIAKYQFDLPETSEFDTLNMSKSFQYNKK